MSLKLTEDEMNTINTLAENEGIQSYQLLVRQATLKGDGYSGPLLTVVLQSETGNINLILKRAERTSNKELRIFRRKSYLREIFMYNNVLREFEIFQNEYNILNGFTAFAKIYGSSVKENNEYVVLGDLKQRNYKMWNRKVPMNAEHLGIVFSEYGKFHALSLAMKEKKSETYHELEKHLGDFYSSSLPKEEILLTIRNKIKLGFKAVEGDDTTEKLFKRFAAAVEDFLLEDTKNTEDHLVITHSDCWCNNILFKYEDKDDPQKPTKVCLVDWQLSKMGSPVLDLSYFFFVCAAGDSLHEYNKYLKIYYNAVDETLNKFSCNVEELFPYSLLEYHWRKYAKFGLYTLLMTINLMLYEAPEDTDYTGPGQIKNSEVTNIIERNQRIINVVNVMAQYDLI